MNKSVNICFVANFYKTFLFHELSKKLAEKDINAFWIVTKLEQYNFLKQHYRSENILYINRTFIKKTNQTVDDFRLNELVFGDRVFKHELKNGLDFLANIQKPVYDFLLQNNIRFVFGEITWAHELLIQRITEKRKELNCRYLEAAVVRIPNKRFAFFTGGCQASMLEFDEATNNEIITLEKPAYLKLNDKIVAKKSSFAGKFNRLKRFLTGENIEINDPNVITKTSVRFKVMSKEELNRITYKRIKTLSFSEIENDNFIFVGFHKQPEASIDVSGRYYEDQSKNIINLWRLLPQGWKIVMKEHTNAIGDRSYSFYKKLLAYPNIVMVHETTDSKKLIEKCKLVATVTGTMAYEAAMMKVPAITFSNVFFNRLNYCKYVSLDDLRKYDSLNTLVNELKSQPDNRLEFSNYLMKNTFNGYISDYVSDASVMSNENLEQVSAAFVKLINKYGE